MDAAFDRVAGGNEIGRLALGLIEAEGALLAHQAVETGFEVADGDAQRGDHVLLRRCECGLDAIERSHRQILTRGEAFDRPVGGVRDERGGCGTHLQQPALKIVGGARDLGLGLHALEGAADLRISGLEGGGVGQKSDERNETKHDDASAHRQPGEE